MIRTRKTVSHEYEHGTLSFERRWLDICGSLFANSAWNGPGVEISESSISSASPCHKAGRSSACVTPRNRHGRNPSQTAGHGVAQASTGEKGRMIVLMVRLRDFSPFAFACPALEQQYQDYQSAHVGSHVGTMCWLLGILWAGVRILALHRTINYPRAWMFNIPVALCMTVGFFSKYAPVLFRKHWPACALAITAAQGLLYDEAYTFLLTLRRGVGRLHNGSLMQLDFTRGLTSLLLAMGCPLSLPAWAFVQMIMFATPDFSLAGKCQISWGSQCLPLPWFVSSALQSVVAAYSGPGARMPDSVLCRVRIIFWRVQMEVMAAVVGVVRDVAWRRSFLKGHPHLIGHDGAGRAAVWPFGSPRTVVTCIGLILCLLSLNVMAIDFWVSAIVRSVQYA